MKFIEIKPTNFTQPTNDLSHTHHEQNDKQQNNSKKLNKTFFNILDLTDSYLVNIVYKKLLWNPIEARI